MNIVMACWTIFFLHVSKSVVNWLWVRFFLFLSYYLVYLVNTPKIPPVIWNLKTTGFLKKELNGNDRKNRIDEDKYKYFFFQWMLWMSLKMKKVIGQSIYSSSWWCVIKYFTRKFSTMVEKKKLCEISKLLQVFKK